MKNVSTILCTFKTFHCGERVQKVADSPDKSGRKANPLRMSLRIQKYPDT